jgi:polyhydroxyalkanoate synthesis regulator phasin
MKRIAMVVFVAILFVCFGAAAYYIIPVMIEQGTRAIKSDINDLKLRMQKIEDREKVAPLKPDAPVQRIVDTVNAVNMKLSSLDDSMKKQAAKIDDIVKKENESFQLIDKEMKEKLRAVAFSIRLSSLRNQLLKIQMDLVQKNVGEARNEIDQVGEMLKEMKSKGDAGEKSNIENLQASLNKAKADMDTDIPSAAGRIEILWREIGKLQGKF